jgi:hypothetical protein
MIECPYCNSDYQGDLIGKAVLTCHLGEAHRMPNQDVMDTMLCVEAKIDACESLAIEQLPPQWQEKAEAWWDKNYPDRPTSEMVRIKEKVNVINAYTQHLMQTGGVEAESDEYEGEDEPEYQDMSIVPEETLDKKEAEIFNSQDLIKRDLLLDNESNTPTIRGINAEESNAIGNYQDPAIKQVTNPNLMQEYNEALHKAEPFYVNQDIRLGDEGDGAPKILSRANGESIEDEVELARDLMNDEKGSEEPLPWQKGEEDYESQTAWQNDPQILEDSKLSLEQIQSNFWEANGRQDEEGIRRWARAENLKGINDPPEPYHGVDGRR